MTSGPSKNTGLDVTDYYLEASADLLPRELVQSLLVDLKPQMAILARELDLPAGCTDTIGFSRWCHSPGSTVYVLVMVLRNLGRADCAQRIIQYLEMHLMQLYIKVEEATGGVFKFLKVKTSAQFSLIQALENTLGGDLAHYEIVGPGPWVTWSTLASELRGKQLTLVRHLNPVPEIKQALYGTLNDCCRKTSLAFPEITDWHQATSLEETHVKEFDHTQMESLKFDSTQPAIHADADYPAPESSLPTSRSNNETPVDSMNGNVFEAMQIETSSIIFSQQDKYDKEEQTISKMLVKKPIAGNNNIPESPQVVKVFPDKRMDIESDIGGLSNPNLFDTLKNGQHFSQTEQNQVTAILPEEHKLEWASKDVKKLYQQLPAYNATYENFAQDSSNTHPREVISQSGCNLTNFNNLSQNTPSVFLSNRAAQNSPAKIRKTVLPGSKVSALVKLLPSQPNEEGDVECKMILDNLSKHSSPRTSLLPSSDLRMSSLFDDNRNHSDLSLFQTPTGYVSHKYIESVGQDDTAVKHTGVLQNNQRQLNSSNVHSQVSSHTAPPKQHVLSHVLSSPAPWYQQQVDTSNQQHSQTSMEHSSFDKNNNDDNQRLNISLQNRQDFKSRVGSSQTSPDAGNAHMAIMSVVNSKQVNLSPLRTKMAFGELLASPQASPGFSQVNITCCPSQTVSSISNAKNFQQKPTIFYQITHSPVTVSDFLQFRNSSLTMSSNELHTTSPHRQTQHRLQNTSSSSGELPNSLSNEPRLIQCNSSPKTISTSFQNCIPPSSHERVTAACPGNIAHSSAEGGGLQIAENPHQNYPSSVTGTQNYCPQQQLYSRPRKLCQEMQPGSCTPLATAAEQPNFFHSQSLSQASHQNQFHHQNNIIRLSHFPDIISSKPAVDNTQQPYCPMLPPVEVKVRIPQVGTSEGGEHTRLVIHPNNYQAHSSVLEAASLLPSSTHARSLPRMPSSADASARDARDEEIIIDEEGYNLINNDQVGARASSNMAQRNPLPTVHTRRSSLNLEAELSQIEGWCPHENGDTIMSTMERYISQDGSFIIWKSRRLTNFIISVSHLKRIFHFRVEETTNAANDRSIYYLFEGGFRSESLIELVQHYQLEGIRISMTASKGVKKYIEHIGLRYPIKSEARKRNVPKKT